MESKSVLNYLLSFFLLLTIVVYYLGESGKVNNFPTYVLGLLVLYALVTNGDVRQLFVRSRVLQLNSLLLCYFAVSCFWSMHFEWLGAAKAIANVPLLLAFMIGILICDRNVAGFMPALARILVLSALVSALYSIYLDIEIGYQPFHEDRMYALGRLGSPVMSALSYGIACVFAIQVLLETNDRVKQTGWLGSALILLYAIYLTGTISVWIGLILSLLVIHALHHRLTLCQTLLRLALVSGIGILVVTITYFLLPDLFALLFPRTFSFRPEIWSIAISRTLDHSLLFGFGHLDSGNLVIGDLEFHHAHSIYLSNFYYGGLIGLMLLLYLHGTAFFIAIRAAIFDDQPGLVEVESAGTESKSSVNLARLCLSSLVYGAVVFALDGDRVLEKVDLIWIAFWLPISLSASIESKRLIADSVMAE